MRGDVLQNDNSPFQWDMAVITTMKIITTIVKNEKPILSGKFTYVKQLIFPAGWGDEA